MMGGGRTLTMPRADGINDGFDTIQGVRSYDNTAGVWNTPDTYRDISDPPSLNSYLWNGNNPIGNMDPAAIALLKGASAA